MDIPTLSLAKSRARGVPVEGGREGPAAAPVESGSERHPSTDCNH